jgi:MFS family permease
MPVQDLSALLSSSAAHWAIGLLAAIVVGTLLRELPRIPRPLLVLMGAAFLDMFGVFLVIPLLPFYCERLGAEATWFGQPLGKGMVTGLVMASFTVAQLLSAPLWGRFSDRYGRRPTLLVALGSSALAYVVFAFADTLWLLLLSRIVQGAGGGTVGVIQAYVADSVGPTERARALGWLSAATNLGVALGPVLGSYSMQLGEIDLWPGPTSLQLGSATPGLAAALLCAANMVFAARWLRESQAKSDRRPAQARLWPALTGILGKPGAATTRLLLLYGIAIGAGQGINAVMAHLLQQNYRIGEQQIGMVYTFLGAISVLARVLLLGPMVDRLGEVRLSRIGTTALALGLALLPLSNGLLSLATAIALLPIGMALLFPCVSALLSRLAPANERGMVLGMQQTFGGFARIMAPLFYGWSFDTLGVNVPFLVAACCVLATLPLGFGLGNSHRPKPTPV